MERIAKLILSFVDLAEVEVQSFKRGLVRFGFTIVYLIAGGILALTGITLLLAAGYIALENAIGRVASLSVIGGSALLIGLGLLIVSRERGEKVQPATAAAPVKDPAAAAQAAAAQVAAAEAAVARGTKGKVDESSMRIAS